MKLRAQLNLDEDRQTYVLTFPPELAPERVIAWLHTISGTLSHRPSFFSGTPTIAFEVISTKEGIKHLLKVPSHYANEIVSQLRTHVPGLRYELGDVEPRVWTSAVELGMTDRARGIRVDNPLDLSTSILGSMQSLVSNQAVLIQWVITPAQHERLPEPGTLTSSFTLMSLLGAVEANKDELDERRRKLSERNFHAVLRIAALDKNEQQAHKLVEAVRNRYEQVHSAHNRFVSSRFLTKEGLQDRIESAAAPFQFPMTMTISDITALIGLPLGSPYIAGLPRSASRHLPAPVSIPLSGLIIGNSNFPGNERPLAISWEDTTKHIHLAAPTGTGKSTTMANFARQIMDANMGMLLIETKNDLFQWTLDYVPKHRLDDVVVIDINDRSAPVGLNVLADGDPYRVAEDIENIVANIHGDTDSIWFKKVVYHGLRTLMTRPGSTVSDLIPLLQPRGDEVAWKSEIIKGLRDPELVNFWHDLEGNRNKDNIIAPVVDRFWHFNSREDIRNILGQSTSSITMADAIAQKKIVMVNLTNVSEATLKFIASLFINQVWRAVRANRPDKPFFLMADEVQNLMKLPMSLDEMLAQARSSNLSMIMANQSVDQLSHEVRSAARNNARTKISYQLEVDDARLMASQFGKDVTEHDLMALAAREGIARISTSQGVSSPVTFTALPPLPKYNLSWQVREHSRKNYGRPVEQVRDEINHRRQPSVTPRARRPKIGFYTEDE